MEGGQIVYQGTILQIKLWCKHFVIVPRGSKLKTCGAARNSAAIYILNKNFWQVSNKINLHQIPINYHNFRYLKEDYCQEICDKEKAFGF